MGDIKRSKIDRILELLLQKDFIATADAPYAWVWKQFFWRFPGAKVILTEHPGGGIGWAKSTEKWTRSTVAQTRLPMSKRNGWERSVLQEVNIDGYAKLGCPINETWNKNKFVKCVKSYYRFQAKVRRLVPKEQLLVYNVSEGWKPLCKF